MPKFIRFIWELPQILLGYVLVFFYKANKKIMYRGIDIYSSTTMSSGISLGYIVILRDEYRDDNSIKHEFGHTIQSSYLGPFYLLIVGLPSIVMNIVSVVLYNMGKPKFAKNYYNRFPENWADSLGGVVRKEWKLKNF